MKTPQEIAQEISIQIMPSGNSGYLPASEWQKMEDLIVAAIKAEREERENLAQDNEALRNGIKYWDGIKADNDALRKEKEALEAERDAQQLVIENKFPGILPWATLQTRVRELEEFKIAVADELKAHREFSTKDTLDFVKNAAHAARERWAVEERNRQLEAALRELLNACRYGAEGELTELYKRMDVALSPTVIATHNPEEIAPPPMATPCFCDFEDTVPCPKHDTPPPGPAAACGSTIIWTDGQKQVCGRDRGHVGPHAPSKQTGKGQNRWTGKAGEVVVPRHECAEAMAPVIVTFHGEPTPEQLKAIAEMVTKAGFTARVCKDCGRGEDQLHVPGCVSDLFRHAEKEQP